MHANNIHYNHIQISVTHFLLYLSKFCYPLALNHEIKQIKNTTCGCPYKTSTKLKNSLVTESNTRNLVFITRPTTGWILFFRELNPALIIQLISFWNIKNSSQLVDNFQWKCIEVQPHLAILCFSFCHMSTVWILIWVSTYLIVLTEFIANSPSLHDTNHGREGFRLFRNIKLRWKQWHGDRPCDGFDDMCHCNGTLWYWILKFSKVIWLLTLLWPFLSGFFIYKTCLNCRKHNYQDMLEIREASRAAVRKRSSILD